MIEDLGVKLFMEQMARQGCKAQVVIEVALQAPDGHKSKGRSYDAFEACIKALENMPEDSIASFEPELGGYQGFGGL